MLPLLGQKIDQVIAINFVNPDQAFEDPLTKTKQTLEEMVDEVKMELKNKFPTEPPFTVQRMAELLQSPNECYSSASPYKFVNALLKVVSVASTVTDYSNDDMKPTDQDRMFEGSYEANGNGSLLLSPISWVIDTGTPPPESIDSPEHTLRESLIAEEVDIEGFKEKEEVEDIIRPELAGLSSNPVRLEDQTGDQEDVEQTSIHEAPNEPAQEPPEKRVKLDESAIDSS